MFKFTTPLQSKDSLRKNRGDATITLILAIVLVSGVFLTGGILPAMREDTLKKDTEAVVQGVRSEDSSGTSFIASSGTTNDAKKTLQMKQLILATVTPSPTGTPIPTPTRTPTPTPSSSTEWRISYRLISCDGDVAKGNVELIGSTNGYTITEVKYRETNTWIVVDSERFIAPRQTHALTLYPTSEAFTWKVSLYSGGTFSPTGTGGTLRTTYEGSEFARCVE